MIDTGDQRQNFQRLVIKVGSSGVTDAEGLSEPKIQRITHDLAVLAKSSREVILVSSGAIQVGRSLGLSLDTEFPDMDLLQAYSALGQPRLMQAYDAALRKQDCRCAQVLLTHEDFSDRQRRLNLRNTLLRLLQLGVIPIVNENDSVSFAEITVGDNDQLAAMIAQAVQADVLILLTEPDGLFDRNPSDPSAQRLTQIDADDDFQKILTRGRSSSGRGGMKTKLEAVRRITPLGIPVLIATYNEAKPIQRALQGGGSYFAAQSRSSNSARQQWFVSGIKAGAIIRIDAGAYQALQEGASLLPSGIRSVAGKFRRGDIVKIMYQRKTIACGIAEYGSADFERIRGKRSEQIMAVLGKIPSKVAIHRNNLLMLIPEKGS